MLYLVDDTVDTSAVWTVETDGSTIGAIEVQGMSARNAEDLALGPCGPDDERSCVYVGDIGDHDGARDGVLVHRFPEPDLTENPPAEVEADVVRLHYPEAWHDAETLMVDDDGALYIVTKAPFDADAGATGAHRLYRAGGFADQVLEDLGPVPVPEASQPLQSSFTGNVVTAGDNADGRVLLRTYDQVLEFVAPEPGAPLAEFPSWEVREVPSAFEPQSEAIAWSVVDCGYLTAGEQVGGIWFAACADGRR